MHKTMKLVFKLFAVVVVATMFLAMPSAGPGSGGGFFGVQDACAQTGTCKASPGDICFVNGNPYYERAWVSGDIEIE